MGKTLFIAEKPKAAFEIMKSPRFRNVQKHLGSEPVFGYFENDQYIVSWALGHLLELLHPEDHDEKYKEFKFEDLPIILEPKYRPKEDTKEQLDILVKLLNRSDVETVVNAADSDREGELIFREIYEYAGSQKPVLRLFVSSYEPAELEAALNRLHRGSDYDLLADSARARQYLDHLLGVTITRGATTKMANNSFLLSSGRVQMCVLHEIRKRELEVENFVEQTYYNLAIQTSNGVAAVLLSDDQYIDPEPLNKLAARITGTNVTVKEFKEYVRKKSPKHLYNLTDLYKDVYSKLGLAAEQAKKFIQNLYENGYITYPRTNSRHLPKEMVEKARNVMQALKSQEKFQKYSVFVNEDKINEKHSSFNDELVTSHFAIIPTVKTYPFTGHELEQKIYEMIVARFMGVFMPAAQYAVREVVLVDQEGNEYKAYEKFLKEKGFLAIFEDEEEEEPLVQAFSIPELKEGEQFQIQSTELKTGKTKRPSLHTESSILTFMETAGRKLDDEHLRELMKGKRIGTVATEETFVPKLLQRGYIQKDGKGRLTTTNIGRKFIDLFPVEEVKSPAYTADMEGKIESIVNGETSLHSFLKEAQQFAYHVVNELAKLSDHVATDFINTWNEQIEICSCLCSSKGRIVDKGKFYGCTLYPDCTVGIPKTIKGKNITSAQVKKLFENKRTDLIKGFKTDEGKEFDAFLVLEDGKLRMKIPAPEDLSLGTCPKCKKGHITNRGTFFGCSEFKNDCKFMIPAKIKGKSIPESQIKKLLQYGQTDFITGFVGETGPFQAALYFNEQGDLKLKFPTVDDRTLGKCPLCRGRVLVGKSYYLCEHYKKTCDFLIPGVIAGKTISTNQIIKLLEKNITDEIKGFKSQKGNSFNARLSYNTKDKKITFVFK
ncbi:DNA topoisomerase [Anoxybacillus rupiensis]|uniref:DNA topoisomerase n=1 Tax=Anoxybacteroides rupiense TaxID=311460 RepID=A0ABD5IWL0_9BACL|nr:DNA topoisomerase [Anoxybacillus rupiensis]